MKWRWATFEGARKCDSDAISYLQPIIYSPWFLPGFCVYEKDKLKARMCDTEFRCDVLRLL